MKVLKIISAIILGIGLIILLFTKTHDNNKDKNVSEKKNKTESKKATWVVEERKTVYFTGEYGEIRKEVLPGDNVSFENASEPYCIHNKVKEYCSQGLEDVGRQMPNNTDNGELRFKSQNGKTGSIDIIFWVWVKK